MTVHARLLQLVLAAAGTMTLMAAEPPASAPVPAPAEGTEVTLTMTGAVIRALDANLEVKIERLKPDIAEQQRRFKMGIFDPHLTTHYTWESLATPQNPRDFFATGQTAEILDETNIRTETDLVGLLPTGTRYKVTVIAYSLKNTLNREALARFYPEYTTPTRLTITQPLLRGFGIATTLAEARIAKSGLRSAEQGLRGKVDQIAADVLDAYIEALYSHELIQVITDRIALALRRRDENEKRLHQGLMAPIDVMQAESTRAAAEIELVRAQAFLVETENRLRELIFPDFAADADTRLSFVDPLREARLAESLPALRALALERSAEYQSALQAVETEKLKVLYAKNQRLPSVNVEASVGYNGLGGTWGGGFSDYSKRTQPDYSIALIADVPLGFHQERANLNEALLHLRSAELEVKRDANHVVSQVQTAYARVTSAVLADRSFRPGRQDGGGRARGRGKTPDQRPHHQFQRPETAGRTGPGARQPPGSGRGRPEGGHRPVGRGRRPARAFSNRRHGGAACPDSPMKGLILLSLLAAGTGPVLRGAEGVLLPFKEVTVSSAVSGILAEVNVKEGDLVEANQPLAHLIDRVEAKEAERSAKVLEQKEFAANGTQNLYHDHVVSEGEAVEKRLDRDIAKLQLQVAQEQLERRQIHSPIAGVVVEKKKEAGEAVNENEAVFHIIDISKVYLQVFVDAVVALKLKAGQSVPVNFPNTRRSSAPASLISSTPGLTAPAGWSASRC